MFRAALMMLCVVAMVPLPTQATESGKPNIIVILADDLGYSDLGCYGGEIRTPSLDALAANGLRFTQCYNSSRCCPSRASLLTGLYPHQAGIGRFVGNGNNPQAGYGGRLSDRCVTMAEVLRPAGYATYACGKWHVNEPGPTDRGFDEFYGYVHGYAVNSWDPRMMIRLPADRTARSYKPGEYFASTALTDHAIDFINIARQKKQPYFLYLGYQAAHFPVQAPPELIKPYVPVYEKGWDKLRAERMDRIKKLGLAPADATLADRSPIDNPTVARRLGSMTADGVNPAWDSLDAARRTDLARRMAVYAAMVEAMDQQIGRLVDDLRKAGELDNTLILFMSDNGACAEWEPFGFDLNPTRFANPQPGRGIDGGTPGAPNVLHTGEALEAMGSRDSLFSYGCAWANLSNTPLRYYKHYAHEGGIRTPLIAHWPAKIASKGKLHDQVTHLMDVMATCVEISGATYPAEFNGRRILPAEGRSLLPALQGKPALPRTLIMEHEHNAALREGNWKLVGIDVLAKDGVRPKATWELYDLSTDPFEQHNLAEKHPDRVKAMTARLLEEARRTLVLPMP